MLEVIRTLAITAYLDHLKVLRIEYHRWRRKETNTKRWKGKERWDELMRHPNDLAHKAHQHIVHTLKEWLLFRALGKPWYFMQCKQLLEQLI